MSDIKKNCWAVVYIFKQLDGSEISLRKQIGLSPPMKEESGACISCLDVVLGMLL